MFRTSLDVYGQLPAHLIDRFAGQVVVVAQLIAQSFAPLAKESFHRLAIGGKFGIWPRLIGLMLRDQADDGRLDRKSVV